MQAGESENMKYVVYHADYGCETGCCGHAIRVTKDDGQFVDSDFTFSHPYDLYGVKDEKKREEIMREFAAKLLKEEFGGEHTADLDWENCLILYD